MNIPKIVISPSEWAIVRDILQRHVPDREVWAFGSRAKWTSKEFSDLDLAIIGDEPLSITTLASLSEDFSESELPYKVDIVDWATTSPSFRSVIERDKVVIQQAADFAWPYVRLGDHCDKIGSGATPKGGKEAYLTAGPYRLIRSQNIHNDGFKYEGLAYISDEQAKKLDGVTVNADDVLLNITGDSVARVCSAPSNVLPARVNQHVAIIRPSPSSFDARFIRYYFASPQQQDLLLGLASAGATRNALTKGMIEALQIPQPIMCVQRSIAETLSALDDKITLLRETNTTLEAIAQALFKSWFVDFDPVRTKAEGREPEGIPPEIAALFPSEFEDSELGAIPKGWRVGKLGEISRNLRVGAKPEELTDDTAYIGLEHMPRQSIALDDWESASKVESGKSRFKMGQILFGKLRPYFHKVGIAPLDGVCSTDILVIEPSSPAWHAVCVCLYSSKALVEHATQLSNGAKMPRTNWADLANYRIVVPPDEVAQAFENIVSPLLDRIPENVHQAKALAETRDALLPRLMSGKLRIPQIQEAVEEATA